MTAGPFAPERVPLIAGWVTLVAGATLVAAPGQVTGRLGVEGHDTAVRAIGFSDLVLVPGLLRGKPRWPWLVGRAAMNLAVAGYMHGTAPQSSSPGIMRAGAGLLLGLTVVDGSAGLALRPR